MKDFDLTKLSRWIIPGWVAILSFFTFEFFDRSMVDTSNIVNSFSDINKFASQNAGITGVIATFLLAIAGVPLGFTIYQIYFFLRWNSPFSRDGFPPIINGRMHDIDLILGDIDDSVLSESSDWKKKWINDKFFLRDHGFRWRYIENFLIEIAQKSKCENEIANSYFRQRYLHELTHTLGACIVSIYFGFFCYFGLLFINKKSNPFNLIWIIGFVGILYILLNFDENAFEKRKKSNFADEIYKNNDPCPTYTIKIPKINCFLTLTNTSCYYLFLIVIFHFFINPSLDYDPNKLDFCIRIFVIIFFIVLWVWSKRDASKSFKIGDSIILGLCLSFVLIVYKLPLHTKSWINWPFFSVITIFLFSNLVLFRNRQNVKNDELALMKYSINMYLLDKNNVTTQSGNEPKQGK